MEQLLSHIFKSPIWNNESKSPYCTYKNSLQEWPGCCNELIAKTPGKHLASNLLQAHNQHNIIGKAYQYNFPYFADIFILSHYRWFIDGSDNIVNPLVCNFGMKIGHCISLLCNTACTSLKYQLQILNTPYFLPFCVCD